MEQLQIGRAKLTWLRGGVNHLDAGAMFGVVPKALWKNHYPVDEKNLMELRTDPILLQLDGCNYLIDTGMGNGKLSEKQMRNFGVLEESFLEESLAEMGLKPENVDSILMTHMHYDHALGLTKKNGEIGYTAIFPDVPIITSQIEWAEMKNPNIRSINTYWKMNWEPVARQVETFDSVIEIANGLKMIHTGGHSNGHSIIVFEDGDESFIHMADIMPTHAHQNKLWVLAYDDYPITSVHAKEKWMKIGYERKSWFTFYHDAYYRAIKWDKTGMKIAELKRARPK